LPVRALSFAPTGLSVLHKVTHGLRRGLSSYATTGMIHVQDCSSTNLLHPTVLGLPMSFLDGRGSSVVAVEARAMFFQLGWNLKEVAGGDFLRCPRHSHSAGSAQQTAGRSMSVVAERGGYARQARWRPVRKVTGARRRRPVRDLRASISGLCRTVPVGIKSGRAASGGCEHTRLSLHGRCLLRVLPSRDGGLSLSGFAACKSGHDVFEADASLAVGRGGFTLLICGSSPQNLLTSAVSSRFERCARPRPVVCRWGKKLVIGARG